jgi:hypothetical protein
MQSYYSLERSNQSKSYASCSLEIDLINLCSLRSYLKYLTIRHRQRRARKGEVLRFVLVNSWIYDNTVIHDGRR